MSLYQEVAVTEGSYHEKFNSDVQTMSSLEIAELTGKRHSDVLRDIRNTEKSLNAELRLGFKSTTYTDSTGRTNPCYNLDKDSTICLISGYDVNARMKIIKRWQKLESQPQPVQKLEYTPAQRALVDAKALFELSGLFKVNPSFAIQEIAKMVTRSSGMDITCLLTQSEDMNNVPDKDVMLEPTELGAHFGLKAKDMNIQLMNLGLQVKSGKQWIATPSGERISERHAWVVDKKSGYNLKWNWQAVSELMGDVD